MGYSSLKHVIDVLKLEHEHQLSLLKMKQEKELNEAKEKCVHTNDDGSSAKVFSGTQWDYYYTCGICGKSLGGGR